MLPAKGCPHQGNWERDPASNLPRGHQRQGKKRPPRRRARIPFPFSSSLTTWTVTSWMTQTSISWKIAERPGPQNTPRLRRPCQWPRGTHLQASKSFQSQRMPLLWYRPRRTEGGSGRGREPRILPAHLLPPAVRGRWMGGWGERGASQSSAGPEPALDLNEKLF